MKDILLLVGAGYLGWYLALNEKEATLNALKQAKKEATKLKNQLLEEAKKNEELNNILDGMSLRKGFDGYGNASGRPLSLGVRGRRDKR